MTPLHLRRIRDPKKMSMLRAGKVAGVHRTTIARWFDRKWIAKYDRLVDIDEVNAVKEAQHLGRKCGKAYPHYEPNPNENIDELLDRALEIIASVWRNAKPHHRDWIKGEISKLNDEEYLNNRHAPTPESRGKIGPNGKLIEDGKLEERSLPMLFSAPEPVPETPAEVPSEPATNIPPKLPPEPVSKTEPQLPLEPVPLTQLELPAGPIADNQPQLASKPLPKAPTQARSKQPLQTQPLKQVEFAL